MTVDRAGEALVIAGPGGVTLARWPLDKLRRIGDVADGTLQLYQFGGDDTERVVIAHRQAKIIIETLAQSLDARDIGWAVWRKIGLWAGGAIGAVVLMVFVIIPSLAGFLAPMIPPEREAAVGRTVLGQIEMVFNGTRDGEWFCSSPLGDAALATMTATLLDGQDLPYDLQVRVVNAPMINAFAAPGGQVVLMDGLIKAADTPAEVAGVLAHEIAHVHYRDPIEQSLRAAGTGGILSLVLGDITGGALIAIIGEQAVNSSYSRAAETRADAFALEMMLRTNLNPEAFASFFDTLQAEYGEQAAMGDGFEWLSTHPNTQGRAANARAAIPVGQTFAPALTDSEWAALRGICD